MLFEYGAIRTNYGGRQTPDFERPTPSASRSHRVPPASAEDLLHSYRGPIWKLAISQSPPNLRRRTRDFHEAVRRGERPPKTGVERVGPHPFAPQHKNLVIRPADVLSKLGPLKISRFRRGAHFSSSAHPMTASPPTSQSISRPAQYVAKPSTCASSR